MEIQENQSFWNEVESEFRKAGEVTIVDFFKELLLNEFELECFKHKQEWEGIQQKLNYRLTIKGKRELLDSELELTISYLENEEEGEFRQIFGDLGQTTLDKAIDKIKMQASLIQKTSIWKELSHTQKVFFITIKNLPSNFIKNDLPFKEAYRNIFKKLNLQLVVEESKKLKPITINRQLVDFANRLFYDHFQVQLNKKLQEELEQFLDPTEVHIHISNSSCISKWKKDKVKFYQLIYALHSADYIDGEVTKVVESLAPHFGIKLADSWQTALNQNINNNNADYKPNIFEELIKGYDNYLEKRTSDNKKRKK